MRFFLLDVFAERRWAGNQLAVIVDEGLSTEHMQALACEMGFSETTFIGAQDASGAWPVRIFTPQTEIPFAGHPTLGSASAIRSHLDPERPNEVALQLGAGRVPVRFARDGVAWMRPPDPVVREELEREGLAAALGLEAGDLDPRFGPRRVDGGISFSLIPLRDTEVLSRARYQSAHADSLRGQKIPTALFLFAPSGAADAHDLCARMFAPDFGVAEDPATGSANACLGAYMLQTGYPGRPLAELQVEQGRLMGRPSLLRLRLQPELEVGGRVIDVAAGQLVV